MSPLIVGITGGIYGGENKYVPIFRFCDILICFGTLSMSFRMCGLALIYHSVLIKIDLDSSTTFVSLEYYSTWYSCTGTRHGTKFSTRVHTKFSSRVSSST